VTRADWDGAAINGVRRPWRSLTAAERLRLVAEDGGSCLLALQADGAPFVDWATLFESVNQVYNADGTPFTVKQARPCMTGDRDSDMACMAKQDLHFVYTYQPGSRYWPFQWVETSAYTMLAVLLCAFGPWWVRHRVSLSNR
jgi:hypothetical protein